MKERKGLILIISALALLLLGCCWQNPAIICTGKSNTVWENPTGRSLRCMNTQKKRAIPTADIPKT